MARLCELRVRLDLWSKCLEVSSCEDLLVKFPFSAKADMMSSLMKSKEEQIEDIKRLVDEMLDLAGKCNGGVWGH